MNIKKFLFSIVITMFLSAVCLAEGTVGVAFLASGHKKFPCKQLLKFAENVESPYISASWGTFGYSKRCWKKYLKKSRNKSHTLQFYISNEVCRRKGNCAIEDSYELLPRLSVNEYNKKIISGNRKVRRAFKSRAAKILKFCNQNRNDNTLCLLAVGLESQYEKKAAEKLVRYAKAAGWSIDQLIHNPVNTGPYQGDAGAKFVEHHGLRASFKTPAGNSIAGLDGTDPSFCNKGRPGIKDQVSFAELRSWINRNKGRTSYTSLWCSVHQGISVDSSKSNKPHLRTPIVDPGDINLFLELMGTRSVPSMAYHKQYCKHIYVPSNGFLWKNSDHSGMVILFPQSYQQQFKKVWIVSPEGDRQLLNYTGKANGDRQHWRHSNLINRFSNYSMVKAFQKKRKAECWKIERSGERNG